MFGLSLPLLLGMGLAALLALGGMGAFMYDKGKDTGFHKRDDEVRSLASKAEASEANYQTEKRDREQRDAIIAENNRVNEQLARASDNARKAAQAAASSSATRSKADESRLAALLSTARTGTESAAACPKTTGLLGEASDVAHTFDRTVGTAAADPPPPPAIVTTAPAAPKPPAPPVQPASPSNKALPPAIRVKP